MAEDRTHDSEAGAPTRVDVDDAASSSTTSPTRLDPASGATRRDSQAGATRIDGVESGHGSLVNLPDALAERFEIERPLPAPGAEADLLVVRARQDGGRFVAKVYRYGTQPKSEVLEAVSRGNPEHVIGLLEHGVSNGRAYELLEYAPLGSLNDRYPSGKSVGTEIVRNVLVELAEALHHLHQQGVIHRDLKPANVLVRSLDPLDLVLTDFGIASASAATVHYTSAHRTIAYAAPETIAGEVSTASDFWSLGIIVSELVTGKHPLRGMTEIAMQARLVSHDVPTRQLPAPWDELCSGLLQRDPRARWQYDRIQAWLRGEVGRETGRRFKLPEVDWRGVAAGVASIKLPRMPGRVPTDAESKDRDEAAQPSQGNVPTDAERSPDPVPGPERSRNATAVRPYTFDQRSYATPEALATALIRNPTDAHKHIARGYIGTWLAEEWRDYDLATRVQDLAECHASNAEVLVLTVITNLDPSRVASYRELPLDRNDLAQALRDLLLHPSASPLASVDALFEHDVVGHIAEARRDEELKIVARMWRDRWTALGVALSDLRPAAAIVHDVRAPDGARAMLLLASLDPTYVTQLRQTAARLLESRERILAKSRSAIERYRRTHPDPVAVDLAVMALYATKKTELDTGSLSQRLLEEAGTLDAGGVRTLLEAGASVEGTKPDEITPLMVAARYNHDVGALEALLRAGANLEAGGDKGRRPLLVAARYNPNGDVIRTLAAAGADVHATDRERRTALVRAARFNANPDVIHALVSAGASVSDSVRSAALQNPNPAVAQAVAALERPGAPPRSGATGGPSRTQSSGYRRIAIWIAVGAIVVITPALWVPAIVVIVAWLAYRNWRRSKT